MKKIIAVLIILLSLFIFFWPMFFGPGVPITPTVGTNDFTDTHYPFRHFLLENWRQGKLPLWASQISTGYPLLAVGETGPLYPLNIISFFLPLMLSVNLTLLLSYLLIGFFAYLYLTETKLSLPAALFGAMVIMFGGFALNQLLHWDMLVSLAWFLAELWLLEKMVKTGNFLYSLLLGFCLGFQFLGGHPQITFYGFLFLVPYFLFLLLLYRKNLLRGILFFLIFLLVGFGLGAVQLLPQFEFIKHSDRAAGLSETAITRFNFPMKDIVTFVLPYASFDESQTIEAFHHNGWPQDERYTYMGILTFFLALWAVWAYRKREPRVIFWTASFFLFLLLSFGSETFLGFILTKPPFNFFRVPIRFLMLADISLAVLAAFGFQELLKLTEKWPKKKMFILASASAVFILTFLDLRFWGSSWKLHPFVEAGQWYKTPAVVEFLKKNLQNQERATLEYYYFASSKIFMTQRHLWDEPRTLINLRNLLPAFNNLLDSLPLAVGAANSAGLKIDRYNRLEMETFFGGVKYPSLDKASLTDSYLFINRLIGVRYVVFSKELTAGLGLSRVFKTNFSNGQDNIYVYEFFDYYPRVFMVPQAKKEEPEKIFEHLLKVDFDPKQTVFLEEETSWGAKGAIASSAQFTKYEDQEVVIKTQSSSDGFLFLSDAYYPGWKAYVDGREKKIYLANYAFRAVEVPQGEHEVVFKYEPKSLWWGIRISLFSTLIVILGIIVFVFRNWRKK